jgi:uncharacterized protein (TIGR03118 family)
MTRSLPFQAVILTTVAFGALCGGSGIANAAGYAQTNLASDISGLATIFDPNLVNTWGVANLPGSPFWIDNQGTGTSSLFAVSGATNVTPANLFPNPPGPNTNFVAVLPPVVAGFPGPTGIVGNPSMSFGIAGGPALFIFANLNGTISAWNLSNINSATHNAATVVAGTGGASYTGLAINPGTSSSPAMLYAANGASGSIDVFNSTFGPVTNLPPSAFVDPNLPAGYVPFNVEDIGGKVYVAYALAGHGSQTTAMAGQGAIAVFDEDGGFLQELLGVKPTGTGELASPWGMAIAPPDFGQFSNDLLVGNFSAVDPGINAFNAMTGAFLGSIPIDLGGNMPGGLWDLTFGSGGSGNSNTLYFTDGINGEKDGLFAALVAVPEPSTWAMMLVGFGGLALFAARRRAAPAIG